MNKPLRSFARALILCCALVFTVPLKAQLTLLGSFDPANASGFCGITYDADSARIWAYDCDLALIHQYTTAGVFVRSISIPGGTANDVDLSMSPEALNLGAGSVPAGRLMVFNGETGPCEVYGVEQGPGTVLAMLNSAFGASHVVGGAYHPIRNTIFMVQDDQPAAALDNLVAEVDPITGAVLNQFDLITTYNVGYGDLEISPATGHLFIVSGDEETILQYTPDGAPTEEFQLPAGVTNISGLALDCATGEAWVCNTSGFIYRLGGFPCGNLIGENNALACADGIDNDGDGVIDCDDPGCQALSGNVGCTTCFSDGLSFADSVLSYLNNCAGNTRTDSSMALGMPDFVDATDFGIVSLGNGGHLNLLFTDNTLTNSGTSDPDLFVFEVGVSVEASSIELRPLNTSTINALVAAGKVDADLDGYYEFGNISGATASVDIDASVPGAAAGSLLFDAVQIVDQPDGCSGATPGADIDAVCALSSLGCSVGSPCDDNNACTTDDVYDAVCNCAGTVVDTDGDGVCDVDDGCPSDPNKTLPGVCGCGVADMDADGDGVYTCQGDLCDNDANKTAPGICGCGVSDMDTDSDGTADCNDGCPADPNKVAPGICGCGVSDVDTDSDGTADCNDACPTDPNKVAPGICGCGVSDVDTDSDGTADCNDACPADPNKVAPGICGCGAADTDSDSDGIADCNDNCPNLPGVQGDPCDDLNALTINDMIGANCLCAGTPVSCTVNGDCNDNNPCTTDACDNNACVFTPLPDGDGDGTCDLTDGCPTDPNKIAPGICGCGVSDADTDSDGTADCNDGCPNDPLKTAPGICGCGVVDTDSDGDGTADCNDGCASDPNKTAPGICGCGVSDADADGDGTADCNDGCPNDPLKTAPGICGCGASDADTDGDGTANCNDGCVNDPLKTSPGTCGCGNPEPGTACDDGNANTNNDVIGANCLCAGTPIGGGCQPTQLTTTADPVITCNIINVKLDGTTTLWAYEVPGANRYQYLFTNTPGQPVYSRSIAGPTRSRQLFQWATTPLKAGRTYRVQVRASFDNGATWCAYGPICTVRISNQPNAQLRDLDEGDALSPYNEEVTLQLFPNPVRDGRITVNLTGLASADQQPVVIEVFDALGRRVHSEQSVASNGELNHMMQMSTDIGTGLYTVIVGVGEERYHQRIVIE